MAAKRTHDESNAEVDESKKEARMENDISLIMRCIKVNTEPPTFLDISILNYSAKMKGMAAFSLNVPSLELPHDDISSETWKFAFDVIINRGFALDPPEKCSLPQMFYIMNKYDINIMSFFTLSQVIVFSDMLKKYLDLGFFTYTAEHNIDMNTPYREYIGTLVAEYCVIIRHEQRLKLFELFKQSPIIMHEILCKYSRRFKKCDIIRAENYVFNVY